MMFYYQGNELKKMEVVKGFTLGDENSSPILEKAEGTVEVESSYSQLFARTTLRHPGKYRPNPISMHRAQLKS